jgi:hypothetical protein
MPWILSIVLCVTAVWLTGCGGGSPANGKLAEKSTSPPPAREALIALEKSANEAWKTRDTKFWDSFLSDRFIGYGVAGKLDKAAAAKEFSGADCEIDRYALFNERITQLDPDVALLTYRSAVDGRCGGRKVPGESAAASLYVREGGEWKNAFHAEAAIVDPKTASWSAGGKRNPPGSAPLDAETEALLAAEIAIWEAWKDHDRARLEALTAAEISFINIFGTFFASKADALKDWTSPGCAVKSVSVSNALARRLSPNVAVLTFDGGADGVCFGQKVGPIRGTSVYVKTGGRWIWSFGINLPARG